MQGMVDQIQCKDNQVAPVIQVEPKNQVEIKKAVELVAQEEVRIQTDL